MLQKEMSLIRWGELHSPWVLRMQLKSFLGILKMLKINQTYDPAISLYPESKREACGKREGFSERWLLGPGCYEEESGEKMI